MPIIRPSSDLRNHFKEIEKAAQSGEPIFLTNKGRASLVLLSNEAYDILIENTTGLQRAADITPSAERMRHFGEVVSNLMVVNKFDDATLSQKSGLSENQIWALQNGEMLPNEQQMVALADALGVDEKTLWYFLEEHTDKTAKLFQHQLEQILTKIVKA